MEISIESNDPNGLLAAMHAQLQSGSLKWNQLSSTMKAYDVPLGLILSCIELLTTDRPSDEEAADGGKLLNSSAAHLLIELVQGRKVEDIEPFQSRATVLFERLISSDAQVRLSHARLAPKVAASFLLEIHMISDRGALVSFVRELFLSRATFAPALALLETFGPQLNQEFDPPSLLLLLVEAGQDEAAIRWCSKLGTIKIQVVLVEILVAQDRLKSASQAVKAFGLEEVFPQVEGQYITKTVTKMIGKRLWQVAIQFSGTDSILQTMVLRAMVEEGEMAAADEFRKLLGLPESSLVIDLASVRAEEERRQSTYLQLSSYLTPSQVLFVDEASLGRAREVLSSTRGPCGLDVEWKPTQIGGKGGGGSRASILQLATEDQVLIFDLIALSSSPSLIQQLDQVLSIVMKDKNRLKLGFEISGDFKVLRASLPTTSCFSQVKGVLDLKHLWFKHLEVSGGGRVKRSAGLSSLCQSLLEKPLDKSMQVSDWEARPLRVRQVDYAALDAYSLLLLFHRFGEILPSDVMEKVVSRFSYDYADQSEDDDNDDEDGRPGWQSSERRERIESEGKDVTTEPISQPPVLPHMISAILERFGLSERVVWKQEGRWSDLTGILHRDLISAEDAARALRVAPDQVVKSIALWVNGAGLVCALRGSRKLDLAKVARALGGVTRKHLSFASKEECMTRFGYPSGSLPPFGHIEQVQVLVDEGFRHQLLSLESDADLFCGVGTLNASLGPISYQQLLQLSKGVEADIVIDTDTQEKGESESSPGAGTVSFLCDSMLGRPHRWLRCLGVDSVLVGADVTRADVLALALKSSFEGRVFLTRDIRLAERREFFLSRSLFVLSSQSPEEQLREIAWAFQIKFQASEVLSRCPTCGAKAFVEVCDNETVRDRVSATVMESVSQFFECGNCAQVFWMGPKSEKAIENVKRILKGELAGQEQPPRESDPKV